MPDIMKIKALPKLEKKLRVAAYCRVSTGKNEQLHSLSAQIEHYKEYITFHPGWDFAGVFFDEAKTGTKDNRSGFQEMLSACRSGQIDMIITKSISRFARNTVTLLEIVRELKTIDIDVFFEEQKIHTKSSDGELMLSILASYAQEESLSASENQKWRVKKNFEAGIPWYGKLIGYRLENGRYEIVPEEAEIVREIFNLYLSGMGLMKIANQLNEEGKKTGTNHSWQVNGLYGILRNDTYTGNLTLQKTFKEDHISKRKRKNEGEYPKYIVEDSHEAIISREVFEATQKEIAYRAEKWSFKNKPKNTAFTGKIVCNNCGMHYRRRNTSNGHSWQCSTFGRKGKAACASKQIPENALIKACTEVLDLTGFDETAFSVQVSTIFVCNGNKLVFHLYDGRIKEIIWKNRSRSESWTSEMKEAARQRALKKKGES